jgi:hypothetical protein
MTELVLYISEGGVTRINLRMDVPTIWLSQLEIAERHLHRTTNFKRT